MFGGLIGVVIGVAVGQLSVGGFQPVVAPYSVVLAFGVSVADRAVLRGLPREPGGVAAPDRRPALRVIRGCNDVSVR